jgi:hypothetical protein
MSARYVVRLHGGRTSCDSGSAAGGRVAVSDRA